MRRAFELTEESGVSRWTSSDRPRAVVVAAHGAQVDPEELRDFLREMKALGMPVSVVAEKLSAEVVRIDLNRPMPEIRAQLSALPAKTRVSLSTGQATLVLLGDDYDGGHKAWVRWPDGRDDIVPGSKVSLA